MRYRFLRELVEIAAEALGRYKLRTALSVLGVVLGVGGVIAMISVSQGARDEALAQVSLLGLDNLVVRPRPVAASGTAPARVRGLHASEVELLPQIVPLVKMTSPLRERILPVVHAGHRLLTRVLGVTEAYQRIARLQVARGRRLSVVDDQAGARVCVLGPTVAAAAFGLDDPIGQSTRIGGDYFETVGVLSSQAARGGLPGSMAWRDLDEAVLVPIEGLDGRRLDADPDQPVDEIWIQVSDGTRASELGAIVAHTMTRLHRGVEDVEVVVPRELLAQRNRTQRTFAVVIGSVAGLALIVGGIGIMNVMLTSVIERTREIGVRRAVGATRPDIAAQFLLETLFMTLTGGTLGVVAGILVSWLIETYAHWQTRVSLEAAALGLGTSFAVGLIFGLYPALRASRLEPVVALHYE